MLLTSLTSYMRNLNYISEIWRYWKNAVSLQPYLSNKKKRFNYKLTMTRYVTILDIARELGISKSTVSRALSGDTGNVKGETLQKILNTAERMGYHRNEMAVNLRQRSTHSVGIIISEIVTSFYMNFINYAQTILRKEGYKVIIAISNENPELERENIQMMEQIRVDGILMSACNKDENVDIYNKVIAQGIPIVFFDRTLEKTEGKNVASLKASQVRMDDNVMAFFMVESLIKKGYRNIVHIPGPSYIRNSYDRRKGYREALEKYRLPYEPQYILSSALSAEEGCKVMTDFLKKKIPFDAVFGFTETALLGAKSALQKQGLRIPDDVALCCMSGTTLCTLVHPTITAVEQPVERMAMEACRLLREHIADEDKQPEDIALRGEMVLRESTP